MEPLAKTFEFTHNLLELIIRIKYHLSNKESSFKWRGFELEMPKKARTVTIKENPDPKFEIEWCASAESGFVKVNGNCVRQLTKKELMKAMPKLFKN